MCTKRVACHEVKTIDGRILCPGVVEIDGMGRVGRVYKLECELAHTIWIGGTIEIKSDAEGYEKAYKENNKILKI